MHANKRSNLKMRMPLQKTLSTVKPRNIIVLTCIIAQIFTTLSVPVRAQGTGIPTVTTLVWENDFETAVITAPTTTTLEEGEYIEDIDYRPENCTYQVVEEEDGNRYYKFYPVEGEVANSGNEYKSGYFKSSPESTDDNMIADPIDEFPIDKLKLEISLRLDNLMNSQLCSHYYGRLNGDNNAVYQFLKFTADGAITDASGNNVGTYTAGEWMNFVIYIDYQQHYIIVNKDGESLYSADFDVNTTNFNQIRMRINAGDNTGVTDMSDLGISIDNIKYSTTYSLEYIKRDYYSSRIGVIDFDDVTPGTEITASTDTDIYYFSNTADTVEVKYDAERKSNTAVLSSAADSRRFGIAKEHTQEYISYQKTGKYPDIVKARVDMKKISSAKAAYIYFGSQELLIYNGSNSLRFTSNETKRIDSGVTVPVGEWVSVSMIINFNSRTYKAYINDNFVAEYSLPISIKTPELLTVSCNGAANNVCIDSMGIYASPYDEMMTSNIYTVDGEYIHGYSGLTVAELINGAVISDDAQITVYNSGGIVPAELTALAQKGMQLVVRSSDAPYYAKYTLDVASYTSGTTELLVNGVPDCEKFATGTVKANIDITSYMNEPSKVIVAIAQYSETDDKIINITWEENSIVKGEQVASASLDIENSSGTYVKAFVMADTLAPVVPAVTMHAYSDTDLQNVTIMYPGHVEKAITFSYDDMLLSDVTLKDIFNDAGIKATFNLQTNKFTDKSQDYKDSLVERYSGHEIASHSYSHPRMYLTSELVSGDTTYYPLTLDEVKEDIRLSLEDIKNLTGSYPIGLVWPYARPSARSDYQQILEYIKSAGIKYARPTNETREFKLPEDWYNWKPTCHHDAMPELLDEFIALESDGTLDLMYVWGHSSELPDTYKPDDTTKLRWDGMREVAEILKNNHTIWKATNADIYNYIEATKLLDIDYDADTISNNSDIDIYIVINGTKKIIIEKNSVFSMK